MTTKQFTEKLRLFKRARMKYWSRITSLFSHLKVTNEITEEEYKQFQTLRWEIDERYYRICELLERPAGKITMREIE